MKVHKRFAKKEIVKVFADAFHDDVSYRALIPSDTVRPKVLKYFFKAYLTMLQESSHLWSENDSYALMYDPDKKVSKFKSYVDYYIGFLKGLPASFYIGYKGYKNMLKVILLEGSDWLDELDNYIHLDMLVVKPCKKGRGFGKKMMTYVDEEAKNRNLMITLETQSENNKDMYEYLGYEIYKTIDHDDYLEYCMIKKSDNP